MAPLKLGQSAGAEVGPGASEHPKPPEPAGRGRRSGLGWTLAALGIFLLTQQVHALLSPFILDDYIFLDKGRSASFGSLWGFDRLTLGWYRPWSRELHYWALYRLFGARAPAYHLASFALWLGVMAAYFTLVRRLAGQRVALLATAGACAMAAWAVPLLWIAGVQDLWMLLFALLSLHALARGRSAWSAVFLALALLSKETAAAWPAVALAFCLAVERRPLKPALARTAPLWAVALAWAAVHPALGGRLWHPVAAPSWPGLHPPLWSIALRTLAGLVNLDRWPEPSAGWLASSLRALPAALALAALAAWATWPRAAVATGAGAGSAGDARAPARVWLFGLAWAALGWTPLLMPRIGWQGYYALAGSLGAWLALAGWLSNRRALAIGVVGAMALLRTAQVETPSREWGTEWYQRRAAAFIQFMRDDLMRKHPSLPPHSRMFFVSAPADVGFMTDNGPALRVWYRDPTLTGGYFSDYRPRRPDEPSGNDYFFRYDSTSGWVEIAKADENLAAARADNPRWEEDHRGLAALFARSRDWRSAALEFEKLAAANPRDPATAFNAGLCRGMLGDSAAAARWFRSAADAPGATAEMKEYARAFDRYLRAQP